MHSVLDRIKTPNDQLVERLNTVVSNHNVGKLLEWSVIEQGLEDCNIYLKTSSGEYLLKIFASTRKESDLDRYTDVLFEVSKIERLRTQRLIAQSSTRAYLDTTNRQDRYVLLTWLSGQSLYSLGRELIDNELEDVVHQAALLHQHDYKPVFSFDSWSVQNIEVMFGSVSQYLGDDDRALAEKAIVRFNQVLHDKLPHAFVHGDIIKPNVIVTKEGQAGVIDFSVCNWYPRIQELAVIVANLLFDEAKTSSKDKLLKVISQYEKHLQLTEYEKESLNSYTIAAMAMGFLGSCQEKYIKKIDMKEVDYWLRLGRTGLIEALSQI